MASSKIWNNLLICPVCGEVLEQNGRSLHCLNQHTFDLAKEGYVNLYLSRGKQPKFLGDDKEMILARRAFLEAGFYAPLADMINQVVQENSQKNELLIDAGCGEGYYLGQLTAPMQKVGVDVSKTAVRLAAKRYANGRFIVSDIKQKLPFADGAAGGMLNIFAPRHVAEFRRVIRKDGFLLIVIPYANHLLTIRREYNLLDVQPDKRHLLLEQLFPHFVLEREEEVTIPLRLSATQLHHLIHMTPNHRHAEEIPPLKTEETTARFRVLLFRAV